MTLLSVLFTACGGGGASSESPKIVGYLVDAPVVNMGYSCGDTRDKTNTQGKFECPSLPITFYVGEFTVAKVNTLPSDHILYPQDLVGKDRSDINDSKVLQMASFLQSLDNDGDLESSIDIPDSLEFNSSAVPLTDMTQEETTTLLLSYHIEPVPLDEAEEHLAAHMNGSENNNSDNERTNGNEEDSADNENSNNENEGGTASEQYAYIPKVIDDYTATRFLNKATFGATKEDIEELKSLGVVAWLNQQLAMPLEKDVYLKKMIEISKEADPSNNLYSIEEYLEDNDKVYNQNVASFHSPRYRMSSWFHNVLTQKDQLHHKLTYALSQIIVESDFEPIFTRRAEAIARYYDILHNNAFGNYKQLLVDISLNSGMGMFLTYNGNKKEYLNENNITIYPDENYAREIMQLFSIGLNELNMDGTAKKDANGNLIPTYTQEDVNNLSKVFTGWDLKRNSRFGLIGFKRGDLTHPLEFTDGYHDFGSKELLGETIPAGLGGEEDIQQAVNIIMKNNNVAPFISKNLIMRLTKSNPSPSYVAHVATTFNATQGDLKAVVKAIFLDQEFWEDIKSKEVVKFKEPLIAYTNFLRAFHAKPFPKWYFCGYGGPSDENASNCSLVTDQFLFNDTRDFLNQGAGLAPTVFNFYDNDFIPNDEAFKAKNYVAPESQIESDSMFINFNNTIRQNLLTWDKSFIVSNYMHDYKNQTALKHYNSVEEFASDAPIRSYVPVYYVGANKMLLDTVDELNVMEEVIDGDSNGDFINLQDYRESEYDDDEKAIKALLEHLNKKLTGNQLSEQQMEVLYANLKDAKLYNKYDVHDVDHPEYDKRTYILKNAIYPAIRAVVTSNTFMTE